MSHDVTRNGRKQKEREPRGLGEIKRKRIMIFHLNSISSALGSPQFSILMLFSFHRRAKTNTGLELELISFHFPE
jgi:hypothetical protein